MFERKHIVVAAYSFFYRAVEPLNFWHVFVTSCDVELGMEIGNVPTHGLKLIIGKDDGDLEPTGNICTNNCLEMFDHVAVLHGVELSSRSKLDVL